MVLYGKVPYCKNVSSLQIHLQILTKITMEFLEEVRKPYSEIYLEK